MEEVRRLAAEGARARLPSSLIGRIACNYQIRRMVLKSHT